MKKIAFSVLVLSCFFYLSKAQDSTNYRPKIYRCWISCNDQSGSMAGVLYEIKDSSVLVSNSIYRRDYLSGNIDLSTYNYSGIKRLGIRRNFSIETGAVIGTVVGVASTIGIVRMAVGDEKVPLGFYILYGALPVSFGAGIGAMLGTLRITVPINGSYEKFKANERRMERYSYLPEYDDGNNEYEKLIDHNWSIGLLMSPSFPVGKFMEVPASDPSAELDGTGGGAGIILGYTINRNFSLSTSILDMTYMYNGSSDIGWGFTTILAGPVFSVPLEKRLFIDMKALMGYSNSTYFEEMNSSLPGEGIAFNPGVSIRYNFSNRWNANAEIAYFYSRQDFEGKNLKMNTVNLGFGLAYRFR